MISVRKDVGLERQERPSGVDEIDAGQVVLLGDLLGPKVLLHGQRKVRPALDRRIVCDDDAVTALDHADTADDSGSRGLAVIELPGRERVQLEEGAARVDERIDPLARRQLAARTMALHRRRTAAEGDDSGSFA